jgi:hypothetical protein
MFSRTRTLGLIKIQRYSGIASAIGSSIGRRGFAMSSAGLLKKDVKIALVQLGCGLSPPPTPQALTLTYPPTHLSTA